jgi:hypothetical protein
MLTRVFEACQDKKKVGALFRQKNAVTNSSRSREREVFKYTSFCRADACSNASLPCKKRVPSLRESGEEAQRQLRRNQARGWTAINGIAADEASVVVPE